MSADVVLADALLRVVLSPARGFLIAGIYDVGSGAPLLWERRPPVEAPPTGDLGPPGPPSLEAFHQRFAGGWFPMFPAAGFTGELDGLPTHFHGELVSLPWEVSDGGDGWLEARVETVASPFAVVRRVSLERGELRVETRVENRGSGAASYVYGEHPCFFRGAFAGGRLIVAATEAWVPSPAYDPDRAVLVPGRRFTWPGATTTKEGVLDLSRVPEEADGRSDHVCLELAGGLVRLTAPRLGRVAELEVDLAATPYALLAMRFDEEMEMLAIEPSGAPGRGVEDALAAGAVRRLAPGEHFTTAMTLRWR